MTRTLKVNIGAITPFSTIDYPGHLCCLIYTQGCNFRCPYCHNMTLVECRQKPMRFEKALSFLKERAKILDAVTITGGEPTIHKDLPALCSAIKKMGYLVKIDTNGSNPSMLKFLVEDSLIDYVAMDIKAPWHKYKIVANTSIPVEIIKESYNFLKHNSIPHEFRTTVHSSLLGVEDIKEILDYTKGERFFLQIARRTDRLMEENLHTEEKLEKLLPEIKKTQTDNKVREIQHPAISQKPLKKLNLCNETKNTRRKKLKYCRENANGTGRALL